MTAADLAPSRRALPGVQIGFAAAILLSAALVFSVQPLVGRMLLPTLGGAPAVWNVSLAFFQAALLIGYGYAHLLQKIRSLRGQALTHVAVLVLAGLALPLRIEHGLGEPDPSAPTVWLILELALTVGAPFAALSATAPLMQAWFARARPQENPYRLYVASNLGSLAALLAYPLVIEPLFPVSGQAAGWTAGYAVFVLAAAALGFSLQARGGAEALPVRADIRPITWRRRLIWLLLAAAPSSLLLGVTAHLATDVASAPFLWIPPLALYLLTFIIAFQSKPVVGRRTALILQAAAVPGAAALLPFGTTNWAVQAGSHLFAFFATALVCHQALSARKPHKSKLTEFYFWVALGGVLGGAFNALLAPLIFERVWEYPLVLVLAGLARPWGKGRTPPWLLGIAAITAVAALVAILPTLREPWWSWFSWIRDIAQRGSEPTVLTRVALGIACAGAFVLGRRAVLFALALALVMLSAEHVGNRLQFIHTERSFFGVHRVTEQEDPELGTVRTLVNGTTLHGAQALRPEFACRPLTYYAPATPIGQAFGIAQRSRPSLTIGAVGLGTGSVVSYVRAQDRMRFFEIDPVVLNIARDQGWFSFLRRCSRGPLTYALGDARVTLRREPAGAYDLLILDAFSSDTVPTHLLTREAVAEYLRVLKPDGVLLLHLSNRNLVLTPFAAAAARAAGGTPLSQIHYRDPRLSQLAEASAEMMVVSRSPEALAPYRASGFWSVPPATAEAWTDDRTAVVDALWRRVREGG